MTAFKHMGSLRSAVGSGLRDAYARAESTTSVYCLSLRHSLATPGSPWTPGHLWKNVFSVHDSFSVSAHFAPLAKRRLESCTLAVRVTCARSSPVNVIIRMTLLLAEKFWNNCVCRARILSFAFPVSVPCLGCVEITHLARCWPCWTRLP